VFPEMEEMLTEKMRQRTLSPDYRDQHIKANAWEWIWKKVKIKLSFM
jgi:hypothetical protein